MQEMVALIFKSNQSLISQMLHGPNVLPSLSRAFHPSPIIPMFIFLQGRQSKRSIGVGNFQGLEEVATTTTVKQHVPKKKRRQATKKKAKKTKKTKKDVIEVGESEEEERARMK